MFKFLYIKLIKMCIILYKKKKKIKLVFNFGYSDKKTEINKFDRKM